MKAVVAPVQFITSQSMTTSFTSSVLKALEWDVLAIQINYTTGTSPVGTYKIQGCVDYLLTGGTWSDLYFSLAENTTLVNSLAVPASTSPILINIQTKGIPFYQVVYTAVSGTAIASGFFTAKRIGD